MSFFSKLMGNIGEGIMNVVSYAADPFDTGYGEKIRDFGDKAKDFATDYGDAIMLTTAAAAGGSALMGGGAAGAGGSGAASTGFGSAVNTGSIAAPSAGGMGSGAMSSVGSIAAPSGGATATTGGLGASSYGTVGSVSAPAAEGGMSLLDMAKTGYDYADKGMSAYNKVKQATTPEPMQTQQQRLGRGARNLSMEEEANRKPVRSGKIREGYLL